MVKIYLKKKCLNALVSVSLGILPGLSIKPTQRFKKSTSRSQLDSQPDLEKTDSARKEPRAEIQKSKEDRNVPQGLFPGFTALEVPSVGRILPLVSRCKFLFSCNNKRRRSPVLSVCLENLSRSGIVSTRVALTTHVPPFPNLCHAPVAGNNQYKGFFFFFK